MPGKDRRAFIRRQRALERQRQIENPMEDLNAERVFAYNLTTYEMSLLQQLEAHPEPIPLDRGIWFVVWVKPGEEIRTLLQLFHADVTGYVPLDRKIEGTRANKNAKLRTIIRPQFSQLVFAHAPQDDMGQAQRYLANKLRRSDRISDKDMAHTKSFALAPGLYDQKGTRAIIRPHLFKRFYETLEGLGPVEPITPAPPPYEVGDVVRLTGGPFQGYNGEVHEITETEVNVWISMMGRQVPIAVEAKQLKAFV